VGSYNPKDPAELKTQPNYVAAKEKLCNLQKVKDGIKEYSNMIAPPSINAKYRKPNK
jgi:hypothetical protein